MHAVRRRVAVVIAVSSVSVAGVSHSLANVLVRPDSASAYALYTGGGSASAGGLVLGTTVWGVHNTVVGGASTLSGPSFGPGPGYPSAESPDKAFDQGTRTDGNVWQSGKYLNFGKADTGVIVKMDGEYVANTLRFATQGTASGDGSRTPTSFTIEGTTAADPINTTAWTTLSGATPLTTYSHNDTFLYYGPGGTVYVNLPATNNAYSAFRILFPTIFNPTTANSMQVNEIEFRLTAAPSTFTWGNAAGGSWNAAANWSPAAVPNAADRTAVFGSAISAPATVTVDSAVSAGVLRFDAAAAYTLAGPAAVTLSRVASPARVEVLQGNHVVSAPLTLSGPVEVDVAAGASVAFSGSTLGSGAATLTKLGAGTMSVDAVNAASLTVSAGQVALRPGVTGASASLVAGLSIATGASLDVADKGIVVDYATGGTSPLEALRAAVAAGQLVSGGVVPGTAVAVGEASALGSVGSFRGVTLDGDMVVAALTLKGDANIDGTVNFDDLLRLAASYNVAAGAVWTGGDFNGDEAVNFDDLLLLAGNYNQSLTGSLGGDWALAQSAVPEPTSAAVLIGTACVALRRSRRRSRRRA